MGVAALARVLVSFVFVIALMLLLSWIAKRLRLPEKLSKVGASKLGGVSVEDSLYLDARHRVVTLRRGDERHVVLLHQSASAPPLLIESYKVDASDTESIKNEKIEVES